MVGDERLIGHRVAAGGDLAAFGKPDDEIVQVRAFEIVVPGTGQHTAAELIGVPQILVRKRTGIVQRQPGQSNRRIGQRHKRRIAGQQRVSNGLLHDRRDRFGGLSTAQPDRRSNQGLNAGHINRAAGGHRHRDFLIGHQLDQVVDHVDRQIQRHVGVQNRRRGRRRIPQYIGDDVGHVDRRQRQQIVSRDCQINRHFAGDRVHGARAIGQDVTRITDRDRSVGTIVKRGGQFGAGRCDQRRCEIDLEINIGDRHSVAFAQFAGRDRPQTGRPGGLAGRREFDPQTQSGLTREIAQINAGLSPIVRAVKEWLHVDVDVVVVRGNRRWIIELVIVGIRTGQRIVGRQQMLSPIGGDHEHSQRIGIAIAAAVAIDIGLSIQSVVAIGLEVIIEIQVRLVGIDVTGQREIGRLDRALGTAGEVVSLIELGARRFARRIS